MPVIMVKWVSYNVRSIAKLGKDLIDWKCVTPTHELFEYISSTQDIEKNENIISKLPRPSQNIRFLQTYVF